MFLLAVGTINWPAKKAPIEIKSAATKNGLRYLLNEIPEPNMAITSELEDSLEVNQITDRNKNIGNNIKPKCQIKL